MATSIGRDGFKGNFTSQWIFQLQLISLPVKTETTFFDGEPLGTQFLRPISHTHKHTLKQYMGKLDDAVKVRCDSCVRSCVTLGLESFRLLAHCPTSLHITRIFPLCICLEEWSLGSTGRHSYILRATLQLCSTALRYTWLGTEENKMMKIATCRPACRR